MRTKVEAKNQEAINDFFEAFGTETAKEYSESIFNLLLMVTQNKELSQDSREDLITKLRDLNRLVTQLGAEHKKEGQFLESICFKN